MLLHHFLEESARKYPEKIAVVERGKRFSYRDIEQSANRLAYVLRQHGVERGERVAVFLDNSVEAVISLFAILKADAVFLLLSPLLKAGKLSYCLRDCGVKAFISDAKKINLFGQVLDSIPGLNPVIVTGKVDEVRKRGVKSFIGWDEIESIRTYPGAPNKNIDIDLASIIYTSGSTANPKGVMLTHLNMISAATSIVTYLENSSEDIIMNVLPLSFDYGLYQILMAFKFGGTVVLEKSFAYPYEIIKTMVREKVTGFPGVPTIFAVLLQMDLRHCNLDCLRYITNTAAALPVEYIRKLRSVFPNAKIYSMYGLTECKRVSYLPPEELEKRPDSVGRAMPNEEVWIVNEKGERAGPGVIGELVVRGSNVMKGYWNDPDATDAVLKPGKLPGEKILYTGDLFKMDNEGFLYFVGRKDDMIKTRGERVGPEEVESALYSLAGVAEAAVVPVPDDILGNAIKACIVLKKGHALTVREVIAHCRRILEEYAVPKYVEFRESFPKNTSGKIDRLSLKLDAANFKQDQLGGALSGEGP
ncbi:MAG: AMP-binding protein [Syntrophales bacterium]